MNVVDRFFLWIILIFLLIFSVGACDGYRIAQMRHQGVFTPKGN